MSATQMTTEIDALKMRLKATWMTAELDGSEHNYDISGETTVDAEYLEVIATRA